jgi:hypothetical protein
MSEVDTEELGAGQGGEATARVEDILGHAGPHGVWPNDDDCLCYVLGASEQESLTAPMTLPVA